LNLILFGAPGAGKGTQSNLLIQRDRLHHISTGDLLRGAIKSGSDLGVKAKSFIDKGELVPDELVIGLVKEVVVGKGPGFILDGFPRTVIQADALGQLLKGLRLEIQKAVFLHVPFDVLFSRLTGRRVCKSCGAVYHIVSKPSKKEGICDVCASELVQRNDDKDEVIANRLKTYEEFTMPLKSYFKQTGQYAEVDGDRDEESVYKSIKDLMIL